jgi:hypothetical protein
MWLLLTKDDKDKMKTTLNRPQDQSLLPVQVCANSKIQQYSLMVNIMRNFLFSHVLKGGHKQASCY